MNFNLCCPSITKNNAPARNHFLVDNPGGGDCAYYALAIALIQHIQDGNLALLRQLGPQFKDAILKFKFEKHAQNKKLLSQLNLVLRKKLFNIRRHDLDVALKNANKSSPRNDNFIISNDIVSDALAVLQHHYKPSSKLDAALSNEIYRNKTANDRIAKFATAILDIESRLNMTLTENELHTLFIDYAIANKFTQSNHQIDLLALFQAIASIRPTSVDNESETVVFHMPSDEEANFVRIHTDDGIEYLNPYVNQLATQEQGLASPLRIENNSLIHQHILSRKKPTVWGDDRDISSLAYALDVQIEFYENGKKRGLQNIDSSKPVVRLNNLNNEHWVTRFQYAKNTISNPEHLLILNKFRKYSTAQHVTFHEVINVLNNYTRNDSSLSRFFHLNWNHHNVALANDLIDLCRRLQKSAESTNHKESIDTVINECIDNLPKNFNPKGDFAKRMDYICLRHVGKTFSAMKTKRMTDLKQKPSGFAGRPLA